MKIIDENYTSVRDLMETRIDCYRKIGKLGNDLLEKGHRKKNKKNI